MFLPPRKRYDFQNHVRRLVENDFKDENEPNTNETETEIHGEEMEWHPPRIKTPRAYRNQIMLSEWLVDIPEKFETEWLMVPCPHGKRCLVVASQVREIL